MQALLIPLILLGTDLMVLENDHVRLEIDPAVFAVRFLGAPGGENFLQPVFVEDEVRDGDDWCDPGGWVTDLAPFEGRDAALRRGPAAVVLKESRRVVLLGPPSEALGIRLKKEFQIARNAPRITVRVTALSDRASSGDYALRSTVRLPLDTTVRLDRRNDTIRILTAQEGLGTAVVKSNRYWLIPIPPTTDIEGLVLGAWADRMEIQRDEGVWTRTLADGPKKTDDIPLEASMLCLIDSATDSYGVAFQGARGAIAAGSPKTLEEVWEFDFRE